MVTPKTVKTVLKMNEDGIDKSEIAMKCDISIQSVEDILKNSNKNKLHISEETMSLWNISTELDCESDNINGISNLLFCAGDNIDELNAEALYALGNNLFGIYEKLKGLSESMMELGKKKV